MLKVILRRLAMVIISIGLFTLAWFVMKHQSSFAFQLGLVFIFTGVVHPTWWPEIKNK